METSEKLYRVAVGSDEIGEYTMADLREFWRSGALDRGAVYFHEGIGQWKPVAPLIGPEAGRLLAKGAPEAKKASGAKVFLAGALGTLAVVIGVMIFLAQTAPPLTPAETKDAIARQLTREAKTEVEARQKAPSTTEWLAVRSGWEGEVLTVQHEFDSENGFGAMLRGFGTVTYRVDLSTHKYTMETVDLRWGPPITAGR